MSFSLPPHLRKYIVEQDSAKYTPIDHAVWRFILRQLRSFLSKHGHPSYLSGLDKTGISVERIPLIGEISEKLSKFGWRALPVSGFIPPATFMELQALGVLPIASDMRTLSHLLYTPAPDIVHEAAGHAPLLADPEYAQYLSAYAQVARKAIISREDLEMYACIRELSDLKENPSSTPAQIKASEEKLEKVSKSISHISEAGQLSRMNWWTAEYGLVGSLQSPKIFGAGLLSSVGESRWCLSDQVRKIPLSVECVQQGYDITEPQPQLFVARDFQHLGQVLDDFAQTMAFRRGGIEGLRKAIQAESVNTVQLNSGLQISGVLADTLPAHDTRSADKAEISYLRFHGPCQLAFHDHQLPGQGKESHPHGFGTAIGFFKQFPQTCPSTLSDAQWESIGVHPGKEVRLEYTNGVVITGFFKNRLSIEGRSLLLVLENARAELKGQILFDPAWGVYDLALGSSIPSVFGGPADRESYGETDDFVAARVPAPNWSARDREQHAQYAEVRRLRETAASGPALEKALQGIREVYHREFPQDWLLPLEMYELALNRLPSSELTSSLKKDLDAFSTQDESRVVRDGLQLAGQL